MFGTLFRCLHCWLWTSEYWMGPFRKFPKTRILEKSGKVTCLTIQKAFTNTQDFQRRPLDFTQTYNLSLKQTIIRVWYFLWLILLFDTQLKQDLQIYTNKFLSSSSYSCLPMKVCESEVYKHIVQPLNMHCSCFFWEIWVLIRLQSPKFIQNF